MLQQTRGKNIAMLQQTRIKQRCYVAANSWQNVQYKYNFAACLLRKMLLPYCNIVSQSRFEPINLT
jgi:hypothetical protein